MYEMMVGMSEDQVIGPRVLDLNPTQPGPQAKLRRSGNLVAVTIHGPMLPER